MSTNPLFALDLAPRGHCLDHDGNIADADRPRFSADLVAADAAVRGASRADLRAFVEACGLFAPAKAPVSALASYAKAAIVHLWWERDERTGRGLTNLPNLRRPARAEA